MGEMWPRIFFSTPDAGQIIIFFCGQKSKPGFFFHTIPAPPPENQMVCALEVGIFIRFKGHCCFPDRNYFSSDEAGILLSCTIAYLFMTGPCTSSTCRVWQLAIELRYCLLWTCMATNFRYHFQLRLLGHTSVDESEWLCYLSVRICNCKFDSHIFCFHEASIDELHLLASIVYRIT